LHSSDLTIGRTIGVTFDHGEDFFTALAEACHAHHVQQGYIPMFIAGFAEARLVGTCDKLDDPKAPVWSAVHLTNIEALGGGTLAYDPGQQTIQPHIHVTAGRKEQAAIGSTSHLLSATVQFLTEMIIIEIAAPDMRRIPTPSLYQVPLLKFGQ
jgi:predicted DNA-binding protein with PD1-like motif